MMFTNKQHEKEKTHFFPTEIFKFGGSQVSSKRLPTIFLSEWNRSSEIFDFNTY